jgi:class 3 adenylate cyclase
MPPATSERLSTDDWMARVAAVRRQGNHLAAFDLSLQALAEWPDAAGFEHQAILALARAGALGSAMARYNRLLASGRLDEIADRECAADFAGLGGRLFKDLAARSPEAEAPTYRLTSARTYEAGYQRFGGYYLAINAAAMFLAAGRLAEARDYARSAYLLAETAEDGYWPAATRAEASLILGDFTAARANLDAASCFSAGNFDALASTRRQLAWVAALAGAPPDLLDHLPGPRVLSWISRSDVEEAAIRFDFASDHGVLAFGPLLSVADLAIAAALLEAGAALHLVLPCAPEGLAASFVPPERSAHVLGHENVSLMLVTGEGGPLEPASRLLCQEQARGLALLRAHSLAVTPELISFAPQGVSFGPLPSGNADLAAITPAGDYPAHRLRQPHAILFGDVRGFSRLTEFQQLDFLEHVIGGFADVLGAFPAKEYAETAGDGLFIVLADIRTAVECSFALRDILPELVAAGSLPSGLGIRLSAHVGPLYRRYDRVIDREKFCGMEVIRTARIEPVTPVGEIYVTEQFAAALACAALDGFICEYVGLQPMAKGFGACRMYSLRRAGFQPPAQS